MLMSAEKNVRFYREQALQLRDMAAKASTPEKFAPILEKLASEYDELAARAEAEAKRQSKD